MNIDDIQPPKTVVDSYNFLQEVCSTKLINDLVQLGGPGQVVENHSFRSNQILQKKWLILHYLWLILIASNNHLLKITSFIFDLNCIIFELISVTQDLIIYCQLYSILKKTPHLSKKTS